MSPAANITAAAAAAHTWDVLVIGAGPAGSFAALHCARRGLSTLLVDKASFPRWKVCGCCLNGRSIALLRAAGIEGALRQRGSVSLSRLRIGAGRRRVELGMGEGLALSREALDAELICAALREGCCFLPEAACETTFVSHDDRSVRLRAGDQHFDLRARLVLAADGLAGSIMSEPTSAARTSAPSSRIGAGATLAAMLAGYDAGVVHMAVGRGGYVGIVQIEGGRGAVAAAFDAGYVRSQGGLARAAATIVDSCGMAGGNELSAAHWKGTPPLTGRRAVAGERLFAIGDAACFVEPFTGEGIAWALTCGAGVADLAEQAAVEWHPRLTREWARRHRALVARRQAVCRGVSALLRRPRLAGIAARVVSWWPGAVEPLVRSVNRPIRIERMEPA